MTACVSIFDLVASILFGLDIAETTVSFNTIRVCFKLFGIVIIDVSDFRILVTG